MCRRPCRTVSLSGCHIPLVRQRCHRHRWCCMEGPCSSLPASHMSSLCSRLRFWSISQTRRTVRRNPQSRCCKKNLPLATRLLDNARLVLPYKRHISHQCHTAKNVRVCMLRILVFSCCEIPSLARSTGTVQPAGSCDTTEQRIRPVSSNCTQYHTMSMVTLTPSIQYTLRVCLFFAII